ncbi:MAG: hypothetical protein E5Y01_31670 [Mesorhizobium sp.]|nr:MAG: hypothetical protein EOR75_31815 [Mesorhizobium sp.]TJV47669.1 MAG: hypothetical protein E5Y01_31670 [Mesorhizobium sp.]
MKTIAGHPIAVGFLSFIVSRIGLSPLVGDRVCRDGWHSMSIGHRGACSWHGGVGGLEHGNWVMPAAIALGVAAGFAWDALQSRRSGREDPEEEWRPVPVPASPPSPEPSAPIIVAETPAPQMQWVSTQSAWLLCPKCSAGMKLRTAQRGRYAGRDFWGCRNYPSCNEIVNIKPVPEMQKPAVAAPPLASLPGRPQSALPPEELERLRERTRRATAESAAYIAAELARAKQRRRRRSR